MGKAGKLRKKRRLALLESVPPMVPCTATRDTIHRDQPDAEKCRACKHHHCRACGICARCRRYGNQACLNVGEAKVPAVKREKPRGAPWWRANRAVSRVTEAGKTTRAQPTPRSEPR